jgi:hypothetical protein
MEVIIFGSVQFLSKKNNQTEIFFEKKTKTGSNQLVSVRFGFFGQNKFKPAWLGFSV